ncbi:MAG: secondary thiamine-phosphate synthase enzyme YjbQ [Desulfomonilaceae bacterium]|nr:secondary thiamine-phosphate synthase enzyme YjbQ [Desulfomonilaceae bacterium]
METIRVKTSSRIQFVDITSRVREAIAKSGVLDGIAVVHVSHTTAGITINEAADPAVVSDINTKLSQLVPYQDSYRHMEGNSDAHIKATLVGSSVSLIISGGSPVLGTWQGIFFCEFDGPRTRSAAVQVVPA